jgi:hypothetical protein
MLNFLSPRARLIGVIVAPLMLLSIYLFFSRWPTRWDNRMIDWIALGTSSLVGAALLGSLPAKNVSRAIRVVIYIPVSSVLLFFYAFFFVGIVFGDWL